MSHESVLKISWESDLTSRFRLFNIRILCIHSFWYTCYRATTRRSHGWLNWFHRMQESRLKTVDGDFVLSVAQIKYESLVSMFKDFGWSFVRCCERRAIIVSTSKNVATVHKCDWHRRRSGTMWYQPANYLTESWKELRGVWWCLASRQEIPRDSEWSSVNHLCGRASQIRFRRSADAQQHPRQLINPVLTLETGHQGRLEVTVKSFHKSI